VLWHSKQPLANADLLPIVGKYKQYQLMLQIAVVQIQLHGTIPSAIYIRVRIASGASQWSTLMFSACLITATSKLPKMFGETLLLRLESTNTSGRTCSLLFAANRACTHIGHCVSAKLLFNSVLVDDDGITW
jgi:hypothetical protein